MSLSNDKKQSPGKITSVFSMAVEQSGESILITDPNGNIEYVNAAFEQLTGYSRRELIGENMMLLQSEEQSGEFFEEMWRQIRGGAVVKANVTMRAKNGDLFIEEREIRPLKDSSGKIVNLVSISKDQTAQNEALADQGRLATVVEATPDIVAISDPDGRLTFLNLAGRKFIGKTDEPIVRGDILDMFPGAAQAALEQEGVPASRADGFWSGESTIVDMSGQEVPVHVIMLAPRASDGEVEFHATIIRDISAQKMHERELFHSATHDLLTGALNRRGLNGELGKYFAGAMDCSAALLILDIDDFKTINDSLGHPAGDEILVSLASVLLDWTGEKGKLARLGGDEFAILIPDCAPANAASAANGLLATLRGEVFAAAGRKLRLSASAGIALLPEHGSTAEEALVSADLALYTAKALGRNRSASYQPSQRVRFVTESPLEVKICLEEALQSGELVFLAQPIVELASGQTTAFELLARLPSPGGALLLPGAFLKIAEQNGLMAEIDSLVLNSALDYLNDRRLVKSGMRVHVNLSAAGFENGALLDLIGKRASGADRRLERLVLEITEPAAINDLPRAATAMERLRAAGCKIALDDFGVGYSSLQHLKALPLDYLKIDGEFVKSLTPNSADYLIVQAASQVAHGLGIQTIAEYVSDRDTAALLAAVGIDYGQGFQFGRPQPVERFLAGLEQVA